MSPGDCISCTLSREAMLPFGRMCRNTNREEKRYQKEGFQNVWATKFMTNLILYFRTKK